MKCKGESRIVHGIDETNLRIMLDLKRKKPLALVLGVGPPKMQATPPLIGEGAKENKNILG